MQAPIVANRCNVCFFTKYPQPKQLFLCSRCSLIRYCGAEHQALDWPIHKDFCRSVQRVLKTRKISHISCINGEINSAKDFEKAIVTAKFAVKAELHRDLQQYENDLIFFPKVCQICFTYKVGSLFDCDECKIAAYCCIEHRDSDDKKHRKICHLLMVYSNFYNEEGYRMGLEFQNIINHSEGTHLFDALQNSCRNEIFIPKEPKNLREYQPYSSASNFSCIATILYALNLRGCTKILQDPLIIYIVGAESEYLFFQQEQLSYFFNHLPHIRAISLHFIGPHLVQNSEFLDRTFSIKSNDWMAQASFHSTTLENYLQNKSSSEIPGLIACFNCGFCEFENTKHNPWRPALRSIVQLQDVTILFTSYTLREAESDLKLLNEIALNENISLDTIRASRENTYKDYRPFRNWEVSDEIDPVYFRNGYLSVLAT